MLEDICSCFHPPVTTEAEATTQKKGILRRKKKERQPISLASKPEPEARVPPDYKWDMEEMNFVGEVIRDDIMKPLSQDMTVIRHNILEPLQEDLVIISNECSAQCFHDDFARENDEAYAAQSMRQLRQKYQQQHPGLMMPVDSRDNSQTPTNKVVNTNSPPKVKRTTKSFTRGIRPQVAKKTGKIGTMERISEGGEKQSTIRVRRRRSAIQAAY